MRTVASSPRRSPCGSARSLVRSALVVAAAWIVMTIGTFPVHAQPPGALLAGMYVPGYLEQTANLEQIEAWAGRPLSIAGTFIDVTDHANLAHRLESAWAARTTPFVNVETDGGIEAVARGDLDEAIGRFAAVTLDWLTRDARRSVIVAPFQEMNLAETPWGCRPDAFREAYRRFVAIFEAAGAGDRIAWAFAPNGWTHAACGGSSQPYFPGDDLVDVVAISAYNFGPQSWDGDYRYPHEVYGPWLRDVRRYAGDLPILIGQTGTLQGTGDRARWLREMVSYLDAQPNVIGFIYFNLRSRSRDGSLLDWRVFDHSEPSTSDVTESAFADVLRSPSVSYVWPLDLFRGSEAVQTGGVDHPQRCAGDAVRNRPC